NWAVDFTAFRNELAADFDTLMKPAEQDIFFKLDDSGNIVFDPAEADRFLTSVINEAKDKLSAYAAGLTYVGTPVPGTTILINGFHSDPAVLAAHPKALGRADNVDVDTSTGPYSIRTIVANRPSYSIAEQDYRLSRALNENFAGTIGIYI